MADEEEGRTAKVHARIEPSKRRVLDTVASVKGVTVSDVIRPYIDDAVQDARRFLADQAKGEDDG